jgi:hypothetical protein
MVVSKVFNIRLSAIIFIAIQAYITPASACFDDVLLAKTLQTQHNSLLYVWSPRMALSATQARLAAESAKASGLQFVPLVDGRIPTDEWQSALQTLAKSQAIDAEVLANSQVLCATKLIEKDAYAHFPTAFVVKGGEIHPNRLIGAMPTNFWLLGMKERLKHEVALEPSFPRRRESTSATMDSRLRGNDVVNVEASQQCIPQNQFIALDPQLAGLDDDKQVALGAYERISPDGRYVLRSYSGKKLSAVSLVELPGPVGLTTIKGQVSRQKIMSTPFSNEAFPVQGSWRYLVDTNGDHYTFNSILSNKYAGYSQIKPLFSGGMDGFYAAAAEVGGAYPLRDNKPVQIRSLSWPNANGGNSSASDQQGMGMLTSRTLTVNPAANKISFDSGRINHCLNRASQDGTMYALPMLSVDGQEFAALPQNPISGVPTMRIFSFGADGKQCQPSGQFTLQSGKVIFGFSSVAKKHADLAYEYHGQVWWVQRDDKVNPQLPLNLAPWEDPKLIPSKVNPAYKDVTANAFPGFTRDGRIIYAANWKRCEGANMSKDCTQEGGYVVSDPFQSNAYRNLNLQNKTTTAKSCITIQEVANERAAFAAFHNISD